MVVYFCVIIILVLENLLDILGFLSFYFNFFWKGDVFDSFFKGYFDLEIMKKGWWLLNVYKKLY